MWRYGKVRNVLYLKSLNVMNLIFSKEDLGDLVNVLYKDIYIHAWGVTKYT